MESILLIIGGLCLIIIPLWLSAKSEIKARNNIITNTGAKKLLRITMPNHYVLTMLGFDDTIRIEYDGLISKDMKVDEIVVQVASKEEINKKFSVGKAVVGTVVFGGTGGAIMGNNGKITKENYEVLLLIVKDQYNNDRSIEITMDNYDRLMSFLMDYKN